MTLNGKDISSWQAGMNAAGNGEFTIVKATQGTDYVNPECDRHYQQAKSDGDLLGVYHFAEAQAPAKAEAEHFLRHADGYSGEAIFFLDWEPDGRAHDVDWANTFLWHLENVGGMKAPIYMSESVVNSHDWTPVVERDNGLWVAKYRDYVPDWNYDMSTAGAAPNVNHWPFYIMWQWTSVGRLDGYGGNVDFNVFYGDRDAWQRYAEDGSGWTPTIPEQPSAPPPGTAIDEYIVRPGDTLSLIAGMFGTTWQHLAAINGIQNPNLIYAGQIIRVRGEAQTHTYTVGRGDTLSAIALRLGTTWQTIRDLNALPNPDLIFPGQVLRVP